MSRGRVGRLAKLARCRYCKALPRGPDDPRGLVCLGDLLAGGDLGGRARCQRDLRGSGPTNTGSIRVAVIVMNGPASAGSVIGVDRSRLPLASVVVGDRAEGRLGLRHARAGARVVGVELEPVVGARVAVERPFDVGRRGALDLRAVLAGRWSPSRCRWGRSRSARRRQVDREPAVVVDQAAQHGVAGAGLHRDAVAPLWTIVLSASVPLSSPTMLLLPPMWTPLSPLPRSRWAVASVPIELPSSCCFPR